MKELLKNIIIEWVAPLTARLIYYTAAPWDLNDYGPFTTLSLQTMSGCQPSVNRSCTSHWIWWCQTMILHTLVSLDYDKHFFYICEKINLNTIKIDL